MPTSETNETSSSGQPKRQPEAPLSAFGLLSHDNQFKNALRAHRVIFFLDFDGTLSPIAPRPTEAIIPAKTQKLLGALGDRFPVFAISGRMRGDLQRRVGLDNIAYFGCHGLDVSDEFRGLLPKSVQDAPMQMERVKPYLTPIVAAYPGALLEDKRYTLALHYRLVDEKKAPELERGLRAIMAQHPQLRIQEAKKVFEIVPREHWDKGKIVELILHQKKWREYLPAYIGDDLPDEPAFLAVEHGAPILVGNSFVPTNARFLLPDPDAVADFISGLLQLSQEMA